jgi:general secretion pathway protein M
MSALHKLRADLETWLGKLSPRERVMVTVALFGVALFSVWLISLQISHAMSAREARIEEKTKVLSQIGKLAEGYRRRQAERQAVEAKLKGPPVQLLSYITQTGATLGVEVTDLRPTTTPAEPEGLREDSVEVSLAKIELTRLARLVQTLERGPGVVKVRRLRLTTRSDDPQLVDATVVISTYQLKT